MIQHASLSICRLHRCLALALVLSASAKADDPAKKATPPRSTDQVEFTIGPDCADAPELAKSNVPQGTVHEFIMKSGDSKIYPGIAKGQPGTVPYERKVAIYIPKQYRAGKEAPFLIAQDGMGYRSFLPTILDNLIAKRQVPPLIAIMINSGGGDSKGSQRGLEYDTVSGLYAEFIETEVLPKIAADYTAAHDNLWKMPGVFHKT